MRKLVHYFLAVNLVYHCGSVERKPRYFKFAHTTISEDMLHDYHSYCYTVKSNTILMYTVTPPPPFPLIQLLTHLEVKSLLSIDPIISNTENLLTLSRLNWNNMLRVLNVYNETVDKLSHKLPWLLLI